MCNLPYFYIETFGCQMNIYDSEKIAGILSTLGYLPTNIVSQASIIILNTCCIRNTAENRILGRIGELKILKKQNKDMLIILVGCMIQQEGMATKLLKSYPFIDILLGTKNFNKLSDIIKNTLENKKLKKNSEKSFVEAFVTGDDYMQQVSVPAYRSSFPNAWVNIISGCNNFCSYCIVPYVRGREKSIHPDIIYKEVIDLLEKGYKEITLLGQNVNSYGNDSKEGWNFNDLLKRLATINKKFRLRFMTSNPKDLTPEIISTIGKYDNISKHIHLPIQSGSNRILQLMNRKYTYEDYYELTKLIKQIPDIAITTDIMVGFPTETEEDFLDTLRAVEEINFHNAFMFVYSPRSGTKAALMPQITYKVKKDRITRLIEKQNNISQEISQKYIGKIYEILIEDTAKGLHKVCGRTDNGRLVSLPGDSDLIGKFVDVKITANKGSSLMGEIIHVK
ncbi:MAG TPA: tRNA (N6-isopentenyl adenosine(37)-C2)-methylthiotransferase MiaB [Clostridia bacterium]|jgi:tRNA-2-methylthio-N6-dimethylallyladenosine synthase|nr:tRNA (N6-isopentenyl adenosine(37)-C2)-methylthiotransferase MiaB [Clostridia bacterium]